MKTSTWVILGVVAVGAYYLYNRNTKKEDVKKEEPKAGFVSAQDKVGTLAKNGL